jgi:hypothetical protein
LRAIDLPAIAGADGARRARGAVVVAAVVALHRTVGARRALARAVVAAGRVALSNVGARHVAAWVGPAQYVAALPSVAGARRSVAVAGLACARGRRGRPTRERQRGREREGDEGSMHHGATLPRRVLALRRSGP